MNNKDAIKLPKTLGELESRGFSDGVKKGRGVRDEIRDNMTRMLVSGEELFPGIVGYEDSVLPQITNAILSKHHFILLGLRGQAKSRILRSMTRFLDEAVPAVEGCEIHDNPYVPLCRACQQKIREQGDETSIRWLGREDRYIEKLATPDVTIADIIGDLDPIRAARSGLDLSDELTIHYGLLPRAHRGDLCHQRAARPRGEDPGRPVQHPSRRGRTDQGLPDSTSARCADGFYSQS